MPNSIECLASSPQSHGKIPNGNINQSGIITKAFNFRLPSDVTSPIIPDLHSIEPLSHLGDATSSSTGHIYGEKSTNGQVVQEKQEAVQATSSQAKQQRRNSTPTRIRTLQKRRPGTSIAVSSAHSTTSGTSSKVNSAGKRPTRESARGRRKSPNSNLPCEICNQLYSRKDNLRAHQRVHSGIKPYRCAYCRAPFRWLGALRTHEGLHLRRKDSGTLESAPSFNEQDHISTFGLGSNAQQELELPGYADRGGSIEDSDTQLQSDDGNGNGLDGGVEQRGHVMDDDVMGFVEMDIGDLCDLIEPMTLPRMLPSRNSADDPEILNERGLEQNSENYARALESIDLGDAVGEVIVTDRDVVDTFPLSDIGTPWPSVWE